MKTTLRDVFHSTFPGLLLIVLTACGGASSSPAPMTTSTASMTTPTPMTTSTYTIGGTVTGLPSGLVLVLQNNAGDDLAVCTDCAFTFKAALANGAAYAVTVKTQPSSPAQNCVVVGNGSGTVDGANVTDVSVVCHGRFAYAANRGDNSISVFSIDSTTGALTVNATSGVFLYTANFDGTSSTISGFNVDPYTGALTALSGSPFPLSVSNYIATDGTGSYLYVTTGAGLVGYGIGGTGLLTALAGFPVASGSNAYSVTVDASNQFLYVGNADSANVSGYKQNAANGELTAIPGAPFAAGSQPDFIAIL